MNYLKKLKLLIFLSIPLIGFGQDDENFEESSAHRMYISVHGGGFHASKKTATYYDGSGDNNIVRIISIPTIYDQIYNKIGYDFYMGDYPLKPRYKIGVNLGVDAGWWLSDYTALTIGVAYSNLKLNETFTLYADDPANPFGEPMIYPQQILATEQRFQFDLGLHHDVGANEKYMTFFEWGANFAALKPVKHEIFVENSLRYNLMYQPNIVNNAPRTEIGYGFYAAMGCRMSFQSNMAIDFGMKGYLQRLKLNDIQGFMISELIFLRFVYI